MIRRADSSDCPRSGSSLRDKKAGHRCYLEALGYPPMQINGDKGRIVVVVGLLEASFEVPMVPLGCVKDGVSQHEQPEVVVFADGRNEICKN